MSINQSNWHTLVMNNIFLMSDKRVIILPGVTGESQTDTNGFPNFPSALVGNQCNAK